MNNDIEEALEKLKKELYNLDEVKTYFAAKHAILEDQYLKEVNELMRTHQKKMVEAINDPQLHQQEKEKYLSYKEIYDNHPIVITYENAKKDVYDILKQISNIIND
ncbi:MAG: YlbF family regulator [Bacilli bacterium]